MVRCRRLNRWSLKAGKWRRRRCWIWSSYWWTNCLNWTELWRKEMWNCKEKCRWKGFKSTWKLSMFWRLKTQCRSSRRQNRSIQTGMVAPPHQTTHFLNPDGLLGIFHLYRWRLNSNHHHNRRGTQGRLWWLHNGRLLIRCRRQRHRHHPAIQYIIPNSAGIYFKLVIIIFFLKKRII